MSTKDSIINAIIFLGFSLFFFLLFVDSWEYTKHTKINVCVIPGVIASQPDTVHAVKTFRTIEGNIYLIATDGAQYVTPGPIKIIRSY